MKKTKTGARLLALVVFAALLAAYPAAAEKPTARAVLAGTVFREPGFALPGAEISLRAVTPPPGVKRFKPMTTRSDGRGEYAFHVPAGKAEYAISVKCGGYESDEKQVSVGADERVDTYFTLRAVK